MKIKTQDLEGPALDWLVCKALGLIDLEVKIGANSMTKAVVIDECGLLFDMRYGIQVRPSTDWSQGGPIIEREWIALEFLAGAGDAGMDVWVASIRGIDECGPTPLIAAMRCYCCAKLGDEVEIPEELK
jgi:hypothetical protein